MLSACFARLQSPPQPSRRFKDWGHQSSGPAWPPPLSPVCCPTSSTVTFWSSSLLFTSLMCNWLDNGAKWEIIFCFLNSGHPWNSWRFVAVKIIQTLTVLLWIIFLSADIIFLLFYPHSLLIYFCPSDLEDDTKLHSSPQLLPHACPSVLFHCHSGFNERSDSHAWHSCVYCVFVGSGSVLSSARSRVRRVLKVCLCSDLDWYWILRPASLTYVPRVWWSAAAKWRRAECSYFIYLVLPLCHKLKYEGFDFKIFPNVVHLTLQ